MSCFFALLLRKNTQAYYDLEVVFTLSLTAVGLILRYKMPAHEGCEAPMIDVFLERSVGTMEGLALSKGRLALWQKKQ